VLATPPQDVKLLFDDEIRPAGGDRAVDARGRSVLAGPAHRLAGNDRALVVPLRPGLVRGAYTVRWRVVSNDGHLITGVLACSDTAFPHVQVNVETSLIFLARRAPMLISFVNWYFF